MSDGKPDNSLKPRSAKFFAEINDVCLPRIDRATVTTVGVQDDKVRHDRSGVLYRIGDEHFILTAAHQLKATVEWNIPLYVSVNRPDVMPIPLGDARFHSTEEDERDVAAIWLPPDVASEVAKYKDFLGHNQVNLAADDHAGPLMFFGYPMAWATDFTTDEHARSVALAFAGHPFAGKRHPTAHYDPDINIVLQFEREAIRTLDGVKDTLPKLHGISGCGIWRVGTFKDKAITPCTADSVTLVGLQHRWFPDNGYIQGTRTRYVLHFLLQNYSHLESAMSIVYPT